MGNIPPPQAAPQPNNLEDLIRLKNLLEGLNASPQGGPGLQPPTTGQLDLGALLAALHSQQVSPQQAQPQTDPILQLLLQAANRSDGQAAQGQQSNGHAPLLAVSVNSLKNMTNEAKAVEKKLGCFPKPRTLPEFKDLPYLGPYGDLIGTYQGQYKDGKRHGFGKIVFSNGASYEGFWQNDIRHGFGVYIRFNGSYCIGEFKNDQLNGFAKEVDVLGATYEGEFKDFKKHGKGAMSYPDGSKYEGEWLDGLWHGKGTYFWPDGRSYAGEWEKDKRHGIGVFTLPNLKQYKQRWQFGNVIEDEHKGEGVSLIDLLKVLASN